ncbi:hypothetical protein GGI23_001584 [Coemansia sp. RSA 2559]|nr:hypothetical protein GGI23_001584 [Coemansia sp. RSA 2559]
MSSNADWFTYYLHPEKLQQDFDLQSTTQRWAQVPKERHDAGVKILSGLFGTGHFREYIISAYPSLADIQGTRGTKYTGPTPPSTPQMPSTEGANGGSGEGLHSISRVGQCTRFEMASDSGLPSASLGAVLKANELPELSTKQRRLLLVAKKLTWLVGFTVEDIEASIHATVRFIYYLYILEGSEAGDAMEDHRFQYRRWTVRSAYREEEAGLTLEVPRGTGIDVNCEKLKAYADSLDVQDAQAKETRFCVAYDLARVYLAQHRFDAALKMFRECQAVSPIRCHPDRFALAAGRTKTSVDEYVDACVSIVGSMAELGGPKEGAGTPVGEFGTMSISPPPFHGACSPAVSLIAEGRRDDALKQCLVEALACTGDGFAWLGHVHPLVLDHCMHMSANAAGRTKAMLSNCALEWIAERQMSAEQSKMLEIRTQNFVMLVVGGQQPASAQDVASNDSSSSSARRTVAEDLLCANETLCLDASKPPLATVRVTYCYLSGLRLLEREDFAGAHSWFVHGKAAVDELFVAAAETSATAAAPAAAPSQQAPVMTQNAEKEKALRLSLATQLDVHAKLASVLDQLSRGVSVDAVASEIDDVLAAQTPIRFEFLEHLVLVCLRRNAKTAFTRLVGTIATNQKLYQQLPEIHIALLQIASLLIVVRDTLAAAQVDVSRALSEPGSAVEIPADQLEKVRKPVAEIATMLLRIPLGAQASTQASSVRAVVGCSPQAGSQGENEIERFCRMWGDPTYLALLGALLAEMLRASAVDAGPSALGRLVTQIVYIRRDDSASADEEKEEEEEEGESARTIVDDLLRADEGHNSKHMHAIAYAVMKRAVHMAPKSACLWLYLSSVASGMQMEEQSLSMFIEYVGLHTDGFSATLVEQSVGQRWFQAQLPAMVRSLAGMGLSGAAAALHQCAADVAYDAAIPLLVQAFEKGEIDQQVAEFFWDPNLIEYGQYLACLPAAAVAVRFAVPSAELAQSRPLVMASLFAWLAGRLSVEL